MSLHDLVRSMWRTAGAWDYDDFEEAPSAPSRPARPDADKARYEMLRDHMTKPTWGSENAESPVDQGPMNTRGHGYGRHVDEQGRLLSHDPETYTRARPYSLEELQRHHDNEHAVMEAEKSSYSASDYEYYHRHD